MLLPLRQARLTPALLLLCCALSAGCVFVPSSPSPTGSAPPAREPQQVHMVPAWPVVAEPRAYSTLEPTGPHRASPVAPDDAKGGERGEVAAGQGDNRPLPPRRRRAEPQRTVLPPLPRRVRSAVSGRPPAAKTQRRPDARQAPRHRPRATYDGSMVCNWAGGIGTDPATVAACRRQYGR
ncbi:hypothetical protein ACIQM4_32300 [Streptomyces sp. NPDC091272]|uniref:hypothetical protein n=1 Tax=Streptomyces sp. NPDC091272 TaxID=3365981 RepID=UPI00381B96B3